VTVPAPLTLTVIWEFVEGGGGGAPGLPEEPEFPPPQPIKGTSNSAEEAHRTQESAAQVFMVRFDDEAGKLVGQSSANPAQGKTFRALPLTSRDALA
jgi:hypothetical protein